MQITSLCPRWDRCSVNNCPLDERYPNLLAYAGDKEQRCPMEKQVRLKIAARFPGALKLEGRTVREHAGHTAFQRLTPAVKSQMAKAGKDSLKRLADSKRRV